MSYEEKLKAWASKRYNIALEDIDSVFISNEYDDLGSGCHTCGHGGGTRLYYDVAIYGVNKRDYHYDELEIDFSTLLKEILEA